MDLVVNLRHSPLAAVCCLFMLGQNMPGQDAGSEAPRNHARSMVITKHGIVATSQTLASAAGVKILEAGGSAVDAAIAANAVLGLVEPVSNGIGGDLFAIVYEAKSGKLHGLNASGWAPSGLTIDFLEKKREFSMPAVGIHSITVPGAVAGWDALHKRYGRDGTDARRHPRTLRRAHHRRTRRPGLRPHHRHQIQPDEPVLHRPRTTLARAVGTITAPTLIIHGTEDPFFPFADAVALAKEIPGADLLPLEGVGHELPPAIWQTVTTAILRHTAPGR